MVGRMPELTEYLPDLKTYLLDIQGRRCREAESFLYWQNAKFGSEAHHPDQPRDDRETSGGCARGVEDAVCQPLFLDGCRTARAGPDPARGEGFWFVTVNRSRSDGLSGFVGPIIRRKVRSEAEKGMDAALKITKTRMEQR